MPEDILFQHAVHYNEKMYKCNKNIPDLTYSFLVLYGT